MVNIYHFIQSNFEFIPFLFTCLDLNELGIAASTGSACASENLQPSVVLNAIGGSSNRGSELSHTGVRFSLSRFTTKKEIDYTIDAVVKSVKRLYSFSAAPKKCTRK